MTEVKIPNHIMRFKTAVLGCRYSLDGESLYSVKWYKDGHEFYRYVPRDSPPAQAFPLPGVNIDVSCGLFQFLSFSLTFFFVFHCSNNGFYIKKVFSRPRDECTWPIENYT